MLQKNYERYGGAHFTFSCYHVIYMYKIFTIISG